MAILGVAPVTAGANTSSTSKVSSLGSQDFLRLLVEQLRNQNPLDPVSASDFVGQTAQLSSVESLGQVNSNISQLLTLQQITQGAALIGKRVSYQVSGEAALRSGVVGAVGITSGRVQLTVGKDVIDLSSVRAVQAA